MALEGLTCEQLDQSIALNNALRATLYVASGVPPSSTVETSPDCERRAMQLVLVFKIVVSSSSFGASAVNSLVDSISSFGGTFGAESLRRGETASLKASGLSTILNSLSATGVQQ